MKPKSVRGVCVTEPLNMVCMWLSNFDSYRTTIVHCHPLFFIYCSHLLKVPCKYDGLAQY